MKHLTQEAKKAIVEKALSRKDNTLEEIACMHNVGYSTLAKWMRRYRDGNFNTVNNVPSANTQLTRAEQFEHLLATSGLDDISVGAYCRERGLYSFQLQQWKNEFMSNDNQKKQKTQSELKALKAENKLLKQDLLRKDRALAETTALLILKKKATLLFGEPGAV